MKRTEIIRLQHEAVFAEMGVIVKEDEDKVVVFSSKKVHSIFPLGFPHRNICN